MLSKLSIKQRHAIWRKKLLLFLLPFFIFTTSVIGVIYTTSNQVEAATSNTLNFHGRLLTNTGQLVPDGSYNIQFNLYTVGSGGTTQWTETHTNSGGNPISVQNGYFSVYLGDPVEGNPFPGTIDWDQEQWLGMTVRGSGSCAFAGCTPTDAEMTPRFKLTAVPYALRAGAITDAAGNAYTGDDLIQKAPSTIQAVNSALAALRLNQTGAGALLQLQGDGTDVFTVDKTGSATLGSGITLGNSSSTTAGTIRWSGSDLEVYNGSGWVSLTSGGGGGGSSNTSTTFTSSILNLAGTASGVNTGLLTFTSGTAVSSTAGSTTGFIAPADGSFRTCLVVGNANRTGGTASLRWRVNGASTGSSACLIDGTNVRTSSTSIDPGVVTFSAGDTINVAFDTSGLLPAGSTEYTVYWSVEYDSSAVSTFFADGGNSFGGLAILGTNDAFGLNIITNGATALSINSTGSVSINDDLSVGNGINVTSGGLDLNSTGLTDAGSITGITDLTGVAGVIGLNSATIQRSAVGTTTIDLLNAGAGTTLSLVNSDGTQVAGLSVEGAITGASLIGNGSGLTSLSATNISSGTLNDGRLSTNVALLNTNQTFTGRPNFSSGLTVGNTTNTTAGNIRWTGSDFEGYDGVDWVSLTGGSGGSLSVSIIQAYDSTGGTDINSVTSTAIPWDAETKKDTGFTHSNVTNNTRVTLDEAGWYKISYNISAETQDANSSNSFCQVELNGTTPVLTTSSYSYSRQTGDPNTTNTATAYVETTGANEYYEVLCSRSGGTASHLTIADQSWTIAEKAVEPAGATLSFDQNGNAFGTEGILGTTDNNGLKIITNSTDAIIISATGETTFVNTVNIDTKLRLGAPPTPDLLAQAVFYTDATTNKGLVIQGVSTQSANLFELQDDSGNTLGGFNSSGNLLLGDSLAEDGTIIFTNATNSNSLTLVTGTATASRVLTLPDADGTLCVSASASCGFLEFASGSYATDSTTNNSIAINKTGASGNIIALQKSGGAVFTVANTGSLQIQSTDSAALDIRNVGGTSYFSVDTNTGSVQIGSATADAVGVLLVLDTKNNAGDPTGVNGAQYYNSSSSKFRCYQNGLWQDCLPAGYSNYSFMGGLETWTNMPAADTEFLGTQHRQLVDLTNATQFRFNIVRAAGTVTAGSDCRIQYATTYGGVYANLDGGAGPEVVISGTAELKTSGWTSIDATARADVYLRIMCKDGNGINDPQFRNAAIQVR